MEALIRHKKISIVTAYKAELESLSNRLRSLSEKYKLSYFLSGLRDEISLQVRMLNPVNLNAAFGLAKIQENIFGCLEALSGLLSRLQSIMAIEVVRK